MPTSRHEKALRLQGFTAIAGVDEAGRGALLGRFSQLPSSWIPDRPIRGLNDSKQLSPERREVLALANPRAGLSLGGWCLRRL